MDNKKFDELMETYVSSTNNSAEKDFRKLNAASAEKSPKRRISLSGYAWAALSFALVIALSLSIFLPLYFRKDGTGNAPGDPADQNQYFDDAELSRLPIDSIAKANEIYGFDIILPSIESIGEDISVICKKGNEYEALGIYANLSIYSETTDFIYMYAIKKNYSLKTLEFYDVFENQALWNGYQTKYFVEYDEEVTTYKYYINFVVEDFSYFIEILRYDDIGIAELLNEIFG